MSNAENIESIKRKIKAHESRKEELRKIYEQSVLAIDDEIKELKIELADMILSDSPDAPTNSESQATFVKIKFKDNGKTYDYLWDSPEEVAAGDTVLVESRFHGYQQVEVVEVFKEDVGYMDHNYKSAFPGTIQ